MDVRILGPLEARLDDHVLDLGGPRPRALFTILVLRLGEVVSAERLTDELWGDRPPKSAHHLLHVYVSRLRKEIGSRLITRAPGYLVDLEPDELDSRRFERLLAEGRHLLETDAERASAVLQEALALWRGPALADFRYEPFAQSEIARLGELRVAAFEDWIDADLARGRHGELAGELEAAIAEHPYRERLRGQLMVALYRAGRQADALAAYQAARRTLVEELGLEPGNDLLRLERAILTHDPALTPAPQPRGRRPQAERRIAPRGGRRRMLAWATVAAVATALSATLFAFADARDPAGAPQASKSVVVPPNSVAVIDPRTNRVTDAVRVGREPRAVVVGHESVWVANVADATLSRIDATSHKEVATIGLGIEPAALAVGDDSIWVAPARGAELLRIDVRNNQIRKRLAIRETIGPLPPGYERGPSAVAAGEGAVWLAHGEEVSRIDPATNEVVATIPAGGNWSGAIAAGAGAVWVAENDALQVRRRPPGFTTGLARIDPVSNLVTERLPMPGLKLPTTGASILSGAIAVSEGSIWAAATAVDSIWRIDTHADRKLRTIPGGSEPTTLAVGEGAVWVENHAEGTVVRIDPFSNERVATIPIGRPTRGIAAGAGAVWVTASR